MTLADTEPHAITRARERYNIELKPKQLNKLAQRCQGGEGRMATFENGCSQHALIVGALVLWVIYSPPRGWGPRWGTIVSVLPPSVGDRQSKNDHRRMKQRKQASRRR